MTIEARPVERGETPGDLDDLQAALERVGYIASSQVATALFLAQRLRRPLLVEGPPGVGKTELAKAASAVLELPLIRLQCYQGLDEAKALYEWKYGKQLLYSQILKQRLDHVVGSATSLTEAMDRLHAMDDLFFSEQFVEPRPLLNALRQPEGAVLLIDEVDKSDEEFEALLLEVLSEYQITIPEVGTIRAKRVPLVVLTSNQQRELGDALRRRCLHLHIDPPSTERELRILRQQLPELPTQLAAQLAVFVDRLRQLDLLKQPAISETLDWANALLLLHASTLHRAPVEATLNVLLKHQPDLDSVRARLDDLLPCQPAQ